MIRILLPLPMTMTGQDDLNDDLPLHHHKSPKRPP
jgi:hypothetical protein